MTKPAVYADQQIPYFWRIGSLDDPAPTLEAHRLDPGGTGYLRYAALRPGEKRSLEHPWPVSVDMAEFVLPGRR
ncbi:hypothetical protein [Pseudonocardia asaccharolytica]|uniref:Uncharacterized protein n=1 Tax=Pseudonocardia asaccharolytica DSM 44247 = NBRC 16224 TaxID=1123024 RepID=A0A511D412_9PSEU|nr:hypothetical protein [Pseudonocardia asaccharolytica]GEL17628.1 hypothetical protein PA7_14650 [Pseudonocardia asaccharolytica DSM 44247 = NBRC 16224]